MLIETLIFLVPILLAAASAYFKSGLLVIATVALMFAIVAMAPWCHNRENLWLFNFTAICGIPINYFLLNEYCQWKVFLFIEGSLILNALIMVQIILICISIEEIIINVIGCIVFPKQNPLILFEEEDKEI